MLVEPLNEHVSAESLWKSTDYWESEEFLSEVVQELYPEAKPKDIYRTAAQAAACVRQARTFLSNALHLEATVQPLLLYYGLLNWFKALVHLFDPDFPSKSSVLQHGISVRRGKRTSYHLMSESVYVYKEGIIQATTGLTSSSLPQRVTLGAVVGSMVGLRDIVQYVYPNLQHVYAVRRVGEHWIVPRQVASGQSKTVREWLEEFSTATVTAPTRGLCGVSKNAGVDIPNGWLPLPDFPTDHPWLRYNGDQLLLVDHDAPPDWALHFILLYCLSSVVRYNPLEWSDIQRWHNETDALFVHRYLERAAPSISDSVRQLLTELLANRLSGTNHRNPDE